MGRLKRIKTEEYQRLSIFLLYSILAMLSINIMIVVLIILFKDEPSVLITGTLFIFLFVSYKLNKMRGILYE